MINVVREVFILLVRVCEILILIRSSLLVLDERAFEFSLILSKITMVAFIEYPISVRTHAINVEPTLHLNTA